MDSRCGDKNVIFHLTFFCFVVLNSFSMTPMSCNTSSCLQFMVKYHVFDWNQFMEYFTCYVLASLELDVTVWICYFLWTRISILVFLSAYINAFLWLPFLLDLAPDSL